MDRQLFCRVAVVEGGGPSPICWTNWLRRPRKIYCPDELDRVIIIGTIRHIMQVAPDSRAYSPKSREKVDYTGHCIFPIIWELRDVS